MTTLWHDLRYGARTLWKNPGFTAVAVFALALGIGANTAIFSVVNAVLFRPLPFADPERIVRLYVTSEWSRDGSGGTFSHPNFLDFRERSRSLQYVAGYVGSGGFIRDGVAEPERVTGAAVSADAFHLLGVEPLVGRWFTVEEDRPDAPPTMVISYDLWKRRYNGDPNVVGRDVKFAGDRKIIGVMPSGFAFPLGGQNPTDYWMPLSHSYSVQQSTGKRGSVFMDVVGKLAPGVTLEEARAELSSIARDLEAEYPAANANRGVRVAPMHDELVREVRPALLVLLGAVGFVLLIACANVANLLLSRANARAREMAVRTALGATRGRILRQLLTESLLLAFLGGAAGLLVALWGVDLLVAAGPSSVPRLGQVALDAYVLAFTFLVSIATGVLFGLAPALQISRPNLNETLKDGGRGSTEGGARGRVRNLLAVSEVALSLVLLVGAGLFIKSFVRLVTSDPGYRTDRLLVLTIPLSSKYSKPEEQSEFFRQLVARVTGLEGIEAAGATTTLPLAETDIVHDFKIAGRPVPAPGMEPTARYGVVTPGFFDTVGMRMRVGRGFTDADTAGAPNVVVVNEAFAEKFFPGEDAVGQRLLSASEGHRDGVIVGVVGDVRQFALDEPPVPHFYVSQFQQPDDSMYFVVRTSVADPRQLVPAVRRAVAELNPEQIIWQTRTMEELLSKSVAARRFSVVLLVTFAALALVLAALGVFGVMTYVVSQRTHEIGIRLALGADRRDVLRLVLGRGLKLALIGVGAGLLAALALTRVVAELLYGVSATDPSVFALVGLLLAAVAVAACYVPARRAMRVDPMAALRYE